MLLSVLKYSDTFSKAFIGSEFFLKSPESSQAFPDIPWYSETFWGGSQWVVVKGLWWRTRTFCGVQTDVLISSERLWKVPEPSERFSKFSGCSDAFWGVLRNFHGSELFERYLKLLRHSLMLWSFPSCFEVFKLIFRGFLRSLKVL